MSLFEQDSFLTSAGMTPEEFRHTPHGPSVPLGTVVANHLRVNATYAK